MEQSETLELAPIHWKTKEMKRPEVLGYRDIALHIFFTFIHFFFFFSLSYLLPNRFQGYMVHEYDSRGYFCRLLPYNVNLHTSDAAGEVRAARIHIHTHYRNLGMGRIRRITNPDLHLNLNINRKIINSLCLCVLITFFFVFFFIII